MKHSSIRRDITDNTYIKVSSDEYNGYFRRYHSEDETYLMASLSTLKDAPTGWIDTAEEYLEDEGFNVL